MKENPVFTQVPTIEVTFRLPIVASDDVGEDYYKGYTTAVLEQVSKAIDEGTLNVAQMFDEGWEVEF